MATWKTLGPDLDDGMPATRQGDVVALVSYPGRVYAAINAGSTSGQYSSILLNKGSGRHEIYRAPSGMPIYNMYYQAVAAAKGKKVIISETGWSNLGTPDRKAVPSYENALIYFINTFTWANQENIDVFYFSSFDETWKIEKEGDVGAYWGLWDKDGNLKFGNV